MTGLSAGSRRDELKGDYNDHCWSSLVYFDLAYPERYECRADQGTLESTAYEQGRLLSEGLKRSMLTSGTDLSENTCH